VQLGKASGRPRDRHGVERGEARAGARARRRRHRRRHARGLADALREANGGARVDIVLEMVGGRVFDASLRRSLRSGGSSLRQCVAGAEHGPQRRADASLARGDRLWLVDCFRNPGPLIAAPLQDLFTRVVSGDCAWSKAGLSLSEARRATRTCAPGAPSGSVWTRVLERAEF